jgi:DsbC/DsbD-like thiol-disulfide interchange protein
MKVMNSVRAAGLAAAIVALSGACRADAQDASAWQKDRHSSVRLLAGSRNGSTVLGGMAFQLDPGWHTYWRDPGDSGVPPRFDFSKSDNIETVTVLWPAPQQFDDGAGGRSLGYHDNVVLPLRITAKNPDQPVTLRAAISYAVCEKICVPVEARAELAFGHSASSSDGTLRAALAAVPKPAKVGDASPLTIRSVTREGKSVVVDVTAPDSGDVSLLVEGPTPDWSLPVPRQVAGGPAGSRRFAFALEGMAPGASADGAVLKFTLVGANQAYEFSVALP